MPRVLIGLAVVIGLFIGGDFFLRTVTETRAEDQVKKSLKLKTTPDVTLSGWPFIFKALGGTFPTVSITVANTRVEGLEVEEVDIELRDVEFDLGGLLSGNEDAVQTGGGQGSASLTEEGVRNALRQQGTSVRVNLNEDGTVTIRDPRLPGAVEGEMVLEGSEAVIRSQRAPQEYRINLPALIEGITYESLTVEADTVRLEFALDPGVLRAP